MQTILALDTVPSSIISPKYQFLNADMLTADFEEIFGGFDLVYHLAFMVNPPRNIKVEDIDKINVVGSERVLSGAVAAGVPKLVFCSSIAVYGAHPDNPEPVDEETALRPNFDWYYSRNKGNVEAFLDVLQERYPKTVIIRFRPAIILGPTVDNPIAKGLLQRAYFSQSRKQRLSMCWEGDIIEAFTLALYYNQSNIFNLAGDTPLSAGEIGRLLGRPVINVPFNLLTSLFRMAEYLRIGSPYLTEWIKFAFKESIIPSSEKAKQELGWKPRFDTAGTLLEFAKTSSLNRRPFCCRNRFIKPKPINPGNPPRDFHNAST